MSTLIRFLGEQAGNSIVDVLYGSVVPAARLPFTIGNSREEYGSDILYQPNNGYGPPQVSIELNVITFFSLSDNHQ
jgi:hypothetical protein